MTFSSTGSFLIACISETLVYGLAIVLFINSINTLLKKRRTKETLNKPLVVAAPFLFFFATLHIWGVWVRTYKGFITYTDGPQAYFGLITTTEKTITQVGQVGGVVLGDLMTVYRTWRVWNSNIYVVLVPTLTFVATVVCAVAFITVQHEVNVHTSIFSTTVTQWTESFLATSLCTTGICTILIAYKLWGVRQRLQDTAIYSSSRSLTQRVLRIIVESAALYSINNFMYALLYSIKQPPEAWFSGLDAPMASITFSLIIIRVESVVNAPPTRATEAFGDFSGSTARVSGPGRRGSASEQRKLSTIDISSPLRGEAHSDVYNPYSSFEPKVTHEEHHSTAV